MVSFSVDPEALDSAADKVQAIADETTSSQVSTEPDWGNGELASAAAEHREAFNASWSEQLEQVEDVASRLRTTADAYEEADRESVPGTGELPD